jgi:hypothetical protein
MPTSVIRSVAAAGAAAAALVVTAGPASAHTAYLEVSAECPETAGGDWIVSWTARSWSGGEAGGHDDVRLQIDWDAYPQNSGWESIEFFSFPVQETPPVVSGTVPLDGSLDEVAFRLYTVGPFRNGATPIDGGWTTPMFVSQPTDCGAGATTTTTTGSTTTTTEGAGATTTTTGGGGSTTTTTGGATSTSTSIGGSGATSSTTPSTGATTTTTEATGVLPSELTAPPPDGGGAVAGETGVQDDTEVQGVQVARSPQPAGGALARTGSDSGPGVLLGVALAAAGSAAVVAAGRLRRRTA